MSEESTPKQGDRVRVTYEAIWDQNRGTHYWLRDTTDGTTASVPSTATVEVIEPADDPSKDPVGTVRQSPEGSSFINMGGWMPWRCPSPNGAGCLHDKDVTGWEVIGAVPGTPAAEAQKPRETDEYPRYYRLPDMPALTYRVDGPDTTALWRILTDPNDNWGVSLRRDEAHILEYGGVRVYPTNPPA